MVETAELHAWLEALGDRIQALRKALDVDALNKRIDELSARMEAPEFWNDPQAAQGVLEELKRLKNRAEPVQAAAEDQANLAELANLVEAEDDAEAMDEVDRDAQALAGQVDRLETAALLSGPNDDKDVFFSVHAGAGGNDGSTPCPARRRAFVARPIACPARTCTGTCAARWASTGSYASARSAANARPRSWVWT